MFHVVGPVEHFAEVGQKIFCDPRCGPVTITLPTLSDDIEGGRVDVLNETHSTAHPIVIQCADGERVGVSKAAYERREVIAQKGRWGSASGVADGSEEKDSSSPGCGRKASVRSPGLSGCVPRERCHVRAC